MKGLRIRAGELLRFRRSDPAERRLAELGHWEGTRFIYNVPIELDNGAIIKTVETASMHLHDDITVTDVLYALAHNIRTEQI